jgi:crotonobetainyl-CoA:carnitine CoA-transferase CaiB-like acyl-CoA transferase
VTPLSDGPLAGVTVLDLTRNLAGPYCTMILGDLGARVIKVERPGVGDDTRQWVPPTWGEHSSVFLALNRNKESIEVDVDTPEGAQVVRDLAATVDVIVESNRSGSLDKRGLGFEQIREISPRIVYCSISGFGSTGPDKDRPGYDTIVQAASGVMSINGEPDSAPSRVGASIIDQGTGMWAALGVFAGLRQRDASGEAQQVQTSLMETGVSWMGYYAANYLASGVVASPMGSRHAQMAPYEGFLTKDGWIFLAALNDNLFRRLCQALEAPEIAEEPQYATNAQRIEHRDELHQRLAALLQDRDAGEWEELLIGKGVPCSRVQTIDQVLVDKQVEALGLLRAWPHPDVADLRLVDHPLSYNGVRSFRHDAPPALGEHSRSVLEGLGYSHETIAAVLGSAPEPS